MASDAERAKHWRRKNPDKVKAQHVRWRKKHPEVARKLARKAVRKYYHKLREKVFDALGRFCNRCGFFDIRALQIDHRSGGGVKEYRAGYEKMLRRVLKYPANYQILCANCNWIKRVENKEI